MEQEIDQLISTKNTARIVGILFIIGTAAGISSGVLISPILGAPDYLIKISTDQNRVIMAALLLFIMGAACSSITIWLYPVLKRYSESLALAAVCFRLAEGVFDVVGGIILLSILTFSLEFIKAGALGSSYFQGIGMLLLAGIDWVNNLAVLLSFCLGALMYYYIFYQTKLIPRWLTIWGFFGITLTITSCILFAFGLISTSDPIQSLLNIPIFLQEIVMAIWLIIKGFNPPVRDSISNQYGGSSKAGET
jgi:vacuolar-type H+-ATPase subunit I/STV1